MPILDLAGAKPLFPKPERKVSRRTLDASMLPQGMLQGGGNGGFAAAKINRLTMDFIGRVVSADTDLFGDNVRLRARARKLALDNPFARKFLAMASQNIVGPAGVLMQAKIKNEHGKETAETKRINLRIEQEWKRWCKAGRCTADGRVSFLGVQHMVIKNCAREGENLTKSVLGFEFNDTGFALQLLDNDQLDDSMMQAIDNGEIRMGVEVNQYRRPIAYHLFDSHPYDQIRSSRTRKRIPASEIVHTAVWERPAQTRGYTWLSAAILMLNQEERYEEAVTVAARASAAKFMVVQQQGADGFDLDGDDDTDNGGHPAPDANVAQRMSANTGEALVLDPGQTAQFIDPRFPTNNHKPFMQTTLRSIATALLVDYPTLANDLEGVNFSSIRAGMLDVRDSWRILQQWFIESFLEPVFAKWLKMALITTLKDITLTPAQMEMIAWKPRGWDWVDPLKDAQAIVLKLQNGLITYADALASLGLDFEETMTERAMEQAFLEALDIVLGTDIRGQADTATDDSMSDADATDDNGKATKPAAAKPAAKTKPAAPKPSRMEEIELARDLFRQLQAAR